MIFSKNRDKDTEYILELLSQVESFIRHDRNSIEKDGKKVTDNNMKKIYEKINHISKVFQAREEEDQGVNGEMLLVLEKMSDGNIGDLIHRTTSNEYIQYLANSLNQTSLKLKQLFGEIISILDEYQRGDYRESLNEQNIREGEIKELIIGINSLKSSITSMLQENFEYGMKLEEASEKMIEKMYHILEASGEQSNEFKSASAMINNITNKVHSSFENTKKMTQFSQKVKDSTQDGMIFSEKTVHAMEEINDATNAISEAIDVIDQIAFQTNILSLNAAVEAATAGEAGKGFAVVASEVRNLASRSADAAKGIKELVEKATQKADEGKSISYHMIEGFKGLSKNIDITISLIEDTARSAKEQVEDIKTLEQTIKRVNQNTEDFITTAHEANELSVHVNEISHLITKRVSEVEFEGKSDIEKSSNSKEEMSYV